MADREELNPAGTSTMVLRTVGSGSTCSYSHCGRERNLLSFVD